MLSLLIDISLTIAGIINFLLFAILIKNNKTPAQKALIAFVGGVMFWSVSMLLFLKTQTTLSAMLVFASSSIFLTSQICFAIHIYQSTYFLRRLCHLFCVFGSFFFIMSFWYNALFTDYQIIDNTRIIIHYGQFYKYFFTFAIVSTIGSFLILLYKYWRLRQYAIKAFIIIFVLTVSIGILTNLVLPGYFEVYLFNAIGPAISGTLTGTLIYIVLRYRFLGIKPILGIGLIYATAITLFIGVFFIIFFGIGFWLSETANLNVFISAGATSALSVFIFGKIIKIIKQQTDHIFYRTEPNYKKCAITLNNLLKEYTLTENLLPKICQILRKYLKVSHVLLIEHQHIYHPNQVKSKIYQETEILRKILTIDKCLIVSKIKNISLKKFFQRYRLTIIIPIKNKNGADLLLIGTLLSKAPPTHKDIHFLEYVTSFIVIAKQKAHLYEKYIKSKNNNFAQNSITKNTAIMHRLQTPLTIAKGNLGLLRKFTDEKLKLLEKTLDTVSSVIYQDLNKSNCSTNNFVQKKRKINLNKIIHHCFNLLKPLFQSKNINAHYRTTNKLYLIGNESELSELLENILENAVKYMPVQKKRKIITLNAIRRHKMIYIKISDTGSGIHFTDLPHIFKVGRRTSNCRNIKGSGIGLARAHQIVNSNGGIIKVKSIPAHATRFIIKLPTINHQPS